MKFIERLKQRFKRKQKAALTKTEKQADKKPVSPGRYNKIVGCDARGSVTLYDVWLKYVCGMRIDAIRRFYGLKAAKYVSKMVTRNDERKVTA